MSKSTNPQAYKNHTTRKPQKVKPKGPMSHTVKEIRWGKDRDEPPTTIDPRSDAKAWPIRRILASRKATKSDHSATQYHVEWDTTWEELSSLQNYKSALEDFNDDENKKFTYTDKNGIEWTAIADNVPLENDSESAQWEMWQAIYRHIKTEVGKNWFDSMKVDRDPETGRKFPDLDFDISESELRKAKRIAYDHGKEPPTGSLDILKYTYEQLDLGVSMNNLLYGDIEVKFVGRIDYRDEKALKHRGKPLTARRTVGPIFSATFEELEENMFTQTADTYGRAEACRDEIQRLIRDAPYMFKPGSWLLLFALLIFDGDTLRQLMEVEGGLRTEENWNNYAREYSMQMYYECIYDNRSPHAIQETFLTLRTFFRELEPEVEPTGSNKSRPSRKNNYSAQVSGPGDYDTESELDFDSDEDSLMAHVDSQDEDVSYDKLEEHVSQEQRLGSSLIRFNLQARNSPEIEEHRTQEERRLAERRNKKEAFQNLHGEQDHNFQVQTGRIGSESPDLVSPAKLGFPRRVAINEVKPETTKGHSRSEYRLRDRYRPTVTGAPKAKRARDIDLDDNDQMNAIPLKKTRKGPKNEAK